VSKKSFEYQNEFSIGDSKLIGSSGNHKYFLTLSEIGLNFEAWIVYSKLESEEARDNFKSKLVVYNNENYPYGVHRLDHGGKYGHDFVWDSINLTALLNLVDIYKKIDVRVKSTSKKIINYFLNYQNGVTGKTIKIKEEGKKSPSLEVLIRLDSRTIQYDNIKNSSKDSVEFNINKANPNYLSSDRYKNLQEMKIIKGVFDVPVLLRKLKNIKRELIFDYDEFYNQDIEAAERYIDSFSETDIGRMGVELRSNDEFYCEEIEEKTRDLIDLLLKYYPEDFTSPYGYFIDWDDGRLVFKITLDEEGRNELIEKYGIDMSELKKSNPDEKKFSASSYLTKKFDLLERVEKLVDHGFEVYSNDYRKSYKKEELAGALLNANAFITSDLFRYTDYGGAYTLAKANILEIESRYPKLIEDELIEVYSTAHNGQNMEFKFAALANDDLYEDLLGLDGYPVLDYQALSEVEMELEDECWTAYGRDMWKDALIEKYGESAEELSDDDLDNLAYEASQYTCCGRGEVQNMEFSFDIDGMIEGLDKVEEGKKPVKKGNPIPKCENPSWAKDEDIWEKAKKESLKSYGRISYPFVVYLYKQMGGKIKKKK
jgi:hypothetical protein